MNELTALIAAGGTGGHLFPALAVVEEFQKRSGGRFSAYFVGNPNKLEAKIVPKAGHSFTPIPITGFGGIFSASTVKLPFRILQSIITVRKIIRTKKPNFILCTGAYLSYPAGIAAKQLGVPLILMESNVFPGKTIKMLAGKADLIITSFEESINHFPENSRKNIKCLGNPLRKMFENIKNKEEARKIFGLDPNKKTVLIFGGSLGARAINQAALTAFDKLAGEDLQFIWQTGNDYKLTSELPDNVKMYKFIDNMAAAYSAADLVVARSGATTISELCYTSKPSILIPLPSASCNEQATNAEELVRVGAAKLINNSEVGNKLHELINEIIFNQNRLNDMSKMANSIAKRSAASDSVAEICKLLAKIV